MGVSSLLCFGPIFRSWQPRQLPPCIPEIPLLLHGTQIMLLIRQGRILPAVLVLS